MTENDPESPVHESHVTRRQVLTRLGAAGAAVALAPSVLAACGGDNSSSGGSATTAASSGSSAATTAASGGGAATTAASGGSAGATPTVATLGTLLGVDAA